MPDVDTLTTRRAFVAAALAAPAAVAPAIAAEGAGEVIDVATHFYDTARPQGVPWPSPTEPVLYKPSYPERYLADVKPYAVTGVVAIEASPWLEDNLWLLSVADRYPLIRGVVGNIAPGHPDFRAALERFSKHPLWRGIRINGAGLGKTLGDARMMGDLRMLMEKNLSLDVLVGAPVYEDVAKLSAALPELRIIVGHLPLDDATGLRSLGARPRVYAKVSGVVRKDGHVPTERLDELWDVFGPDRVLYASNWPACDMIARYPVVYKTVLDYLAGRPEEVRAKYFAGNAQAVYRLTTSTSR